MAISNTAIIRTVVRSRDQSHMIYTEIHTNKRSEMTVLAIVCVVFFVVTEAAYTELGTVYADKDG